RRGRADDVGRKKAGGLRVRIPSLIGRDLGDQHDDAEARVEPPMTSAPVPRVDPADRAMHSVTSSEPAITEAPQPAPTVGGNGLAREDLHKLHAALHDLVECRNLIDAVATR